jgi:hypothetical protein
MLTKQQWLILKVAALILFLPVAYLYYGATLINVDKDLSALLFLYLMMTLGSLGLPAYILATLIGIWREKIRAIRWMFWSSLGLLTYTAVLLFFAFFLPDLFFCSENCTAPPLWTAGILLFTSIPLVVSFKMRRGLRKTA